jgi:hypothetical protein
MAPTDDVYLSNMFLALPSSSQNDSDAGNDLESLANMDLRHLDLNPSVSFEIVASPHSVDIL